MLLRKIFLVGVAIGSFGCGQTSSGDDGGTDAKGSDGQSSDVQAFDQITTGCVNGSQQSYPYDASACTPQLETSYSCSGSICSWTAIVPCTTPSDAGADADAGDGGIDCMTICNAVKPQGQQPPGFCQPGATNDAGTTIICGGCGV
jgi:hypothetical protein